MGLWQSIGEFFGLSERHYVAEEGAFEELNLPKIRRQLRLAEEGASRGLRDQPPTATDELDPVEKTVVATLQRELHRAEERCTQQLQAYHARIALIRKQSLAAQMEAVTRSAIADIRTRHRVGKDELHQLLRAVRERSKDLLHFTKQNRLERQAQYPESRILHYGVLTVMLLLETAANGLLFSRGLEGLIMGWAYALVIALMNITFGFTAAVALFPQMSHNRRWRRWFGFLMAPLYAVVAVLFNIFVAHYREALQTAEPGTPSTAYAHMRQGIFDISSFEGWSLFLIGCAFSFRAAYDGWKLDDPYPGFGVRHRRRAEAETDYVEEKNKAVEELKRARDKADRKLEALFEQLEVEHREERAILEQGRRLHEQYLAYRSHLEQAANQLLATYRDANGTNRSTPAPAHFAVNWSLPTTGRVQPLEPPPSSDIDAVKSTLTAALRTQRRELDRAYQAALNDFEQLSDLEPEEASNGAA